MASKTLKKPKSFTIDRAKWWRGALPHTSRLWLRDTDAGCCLGHYAIACGASIHDITGEPYPSSLAIGKNICLPGMIGDNEGNSTIASLLAQRNDAWNTTNTERERLIRAGFLRIGVRVTFKGRGDPAKGAK